MKADRSIDSASDALARSKRRKTEDPPTAGPSKDTSDKSESSFDTSQGWDAEDSDTGAAEDAVEAEAEEEDEEEDADVVARPHAAVRTGAECPYLDTVDRHALDFDFEKCCSVSLRPDNVYVCLVCGKYFQVWVGGPASPPAASRVR